MGLRLPTTTGGAAERSPFHRKQPPRTEAPAQYSRWRLAGAFRAPGLYSSDPPVISAARSLDKDRMPGNPILLCAPPGELRDRLHQQLTASGFPVSTVQTPAEAVAALRDARYDLVVADGLAVTGAIGSIRSASTIPTPCLVVAPAGDVEARIAFLE